MNARAGLWVLLGLALAGLSIAATTPPAPVTAPTATASSIPAPRAEDQCFVCHKDIESAETRTWETDVHFVAGMGCASCHGGDPTKDDEEAGMNRAIGYKGKIRKADIPGLCGECHGAKHTTWRERYKLTDVADSLMAGVHGQSLRESDKGPQCVSCHGVHGILAVDDPRAPVGPLHVAQTCANCHSNAKYMREFDPRLPVDQFTKYLTSEHGKRNAGGDSKTATCVSCHSNHTIYKVKDPRSPVYATKVPATCAKCHADAKYMAKYDIPTDQYDQYRKSRHGVALLEKFDLNAPACNSCHGNHGALPPGSADVVAICGNCHQSNAELFQKSPHKDVFAKKKLPGCVVCHGNHAIDAPTDELVSLAPKTPCAKCHRADRSDRSAPAIASLHAVLDSLHAGQAETLKLLDRAEQLGMDVSDARYDLKGAHQALVESRVAIHSFRLADLREVAQPGIVIVSAARRTANDAIKEYYFRRKGLAVSTLIVTLMAILLYLKIREIDKEARRG